MLHRPTAALLLAATFSIAPLAAAQVVTSGTGNDNVDRASQAQRSATNSERSDLNSAISSLKAAQERVSADFKAAPELWQAEQDLDAAQAEFDAASKPILDKLSDDPQYKEEKAKQDAYEAKIQQEHQKAVEADPASTKPVSPLPKDHDPTDNSTVTAETERLNVPVPTDAQLVAAVDKAQQRTKLRELQEGAIAKDPKASEAAAKLKAANEKLRQLALTHRAELLNNPEYKAALDRVHSARASVQRAANADYGGAGGNGSYNGNGVNR